jgi:hypothetical protein
MATKSINIKKLGKIVKVENYQVKNQFLIVYEKGTALQSYETLVAVRFGGQIYLSEKHDYSRTTCKYVGQFTGMDTAERRKGLENGTIGTIK